MDGEVTRDVYPGVGPNGEEVRLYSLGDIDLPSVTSILKTRDEDMSNLYDWQDRHDGEGDNAHHEHWFWYSRHRGTLAHFHALQSLDPSLGWSADEAQSIWALANVDEMNDPEEYPEVADASPREVLYSVVKYLGEIEDWGEFYGRYPPYRNHDFYSDGIVDRKDRDVAWFTEQFDRICHKIGLGPDSAIEVERFLFDQEYGYAGQCDLLLEYPDGQIAMADLKTKKGAYMKEKLQGAAYAHAVERDPNIPVDEVDRTEVWCLHPDTGKYAIYSEDASPSPIHTSQYWNTGWHDLWDEFEALLDDYDYQLPDDE